MKINPSIAITGKTIEGNSGIWASAFILSVSVLNSRSILLNVPAALTRADLLAVTADVASFDLTCLLLYLDYATLPSKASSLTSYAKYYVCSEIDDSYWSNCLI